MIGRVVSTKMKNTAVVLVERTAQHPLYKKTFIRSKKYLVGADGSIKDGDIVEIIKIKPISKNKHWKIFKVIGANLAAINKEQLKVAAEKAIAEVMPEEKEEVPQAERVSQVPRVEKPRDTRDTSKTRGTYKNKETK